MTIYDQELGQVINRKGVQPRYEQSLLTGNKRVWCFTTPILMFVNTLHNACRSVNSAMYCFHTNRQLNLPDQMLGLPATTTKLLRPGTIRWWRYVTACKLSERIAKSDSLITGHLRTCLMTLRGERKQNWPWVLGHLYTASRKIQVFH